MSEEILRAMSRLNQNGDGQDFINYLKELSLKNYNEWKEKGTDVFRGKALAYDGLIKDFEKADDKLSKFKVKELDTW